MQVISTAYNKLAKKLKRVFMFRPIYTIASYTLFEALRNRLSWLFIVVALIGLGLSGFVKELALTESRDIQVAIMAAYLRFSAVFILVIFVVTSITRESHEKGIELLLALAIPRASYLFGKLLGFNVLAICVASLFGVFLLFLNSPLQSLMWTISLILELCIMVAFSMLCVISFTQIMSALSATMGFYLLARSIAALELISRESQNETSLSQRVITVVIHGLSSVLPHLDEFTRTSWLIYESESSMSLTLLNLVTQTAICLTLLISAILFDFYRKNI